MGQCERIAVFLSFVLDSLTPFLRNRTTWLIKSPKLFITDAGLAPHLTAVTDLSAASGEPLRGALFETYALQNPAAIFGAYLPRAEVAFWNVKGAAIEVKDLLD